MTLKAISEAVKKVTGIDVSIRTNKANSQDARKIFCALANEFTELSHKDIAIFLGLTSHSSVSYSRNKLEDYLSYDKHFEAKYNRCRELVETIFKVKKQ